MNIFAYVLRSQMLIYLSLSGILLSVILYFRGARLNRSSAYLAGFFFLVSLYSFFIYALFYSKSVTLVSLAFVNATSITFLIGPMIYWYTRSVLSDDHRLRKTDILHLLPAFIFLATSLPYIFSPYQEKLKIAEELVRNIEFMGTFKPTVLYNLLPAEVIFLSRTVLVLAYTIACIWMLFRYISGGKSDRVILNQQYMTKWLMVLLGLLLILAISHTFFVLEVVAERSSRLFYTLNLLQIFSAIGLAGLLVTPHFFPSILYGLPMIPTNPVGSPEKEPDFRISLQVNRNAKSHMLSKDYLVHIENLLESTMMNQKPFLKSDLNLPQLSVLLNIPVHHLAYFFREHLGQSFNDYRNKFRIDHAKQLIKEGKARDLKLEAIGNLSGFTSRNTFFLAFKRAEGISPSDFASRFKGNF
jgi:AraC-like DNA-binding protein